MVGNAELFENGIDRARKQLHEVIGKDTLINFRDDIKDVYFETKELDDVDIHTKRKWVRIGRQGLEEQKSRYLTLSKATDILDWLDWFLTLLFAGAIAWIANEFGFPMIPSIILSAAFSITLNLLNNGLLLGKALLEEIAFPYNSFSPRLDPKELRFRAGWNKGVIQSNTSILGMIVFSVLTSTDSKGYRLGLKIVRWYHQR